MAGNNLTDHITLPITAAHKMVNLSFFMNISLKFTVSVVNVFLMN